jgi:hypothetical protein
MYLTKLHAVYTLCDVAGKKPQARRAPKDQIVNIRLSAELKERFMKEADALGMDVSTFLRVAALEKIERRGQ